VDLRHVDPDVTGEVDAASEPAAGV
jgi:hypothetical protein